MTKLEKLEKSVAALPKAEMDQFADWFDQLRAAGWDAEIKSDVNSGILSSLADNALNAHRNGQTTAL